MFSNNPYSCCIMDIVYNAKILVGKVAVKPAVNPTGRGERHGSKSRYVFPHEAN